MHNLTKTFCCVALSTLTIACDAEPMGRDPGASSDAADRIVGGEDTDIRDVPWQVSMQTNGGFPFCGGSILNEEWILTAAHCVDGQSASSMRIVAGISRQSETSGLGQVRAVDEIISFPGYENPQKGRDIALLHLSGALDLSGPRARAIDIATPDDAPWTAAGRSALVSGWGTLSSGGQAPNTLQSVTVPLVSNAEANAAYSAAGGSVTPDQLGAGLIGVGGKDSCQGDSGGPLVVESASGPLLAGVVSWGFSCADPRFPGMYARVSSFADWIFEHTDIMDGGDPPELPAAQSCAGNCGGQAAGGCWCDSQCVGFGDCCLDVNDAC